MDELDQRLIDLLRTDARAPAARLARLLGLSRTTVQSRLERLERSGVIAGYTVRLAEGHDRLQITAYVMMTVAPRRANDVAAAARGMAAVRRLQAVSGAVRPRRRGGHALGRRDGRRDRRPRRDPRRRTHHLGHRPGL